MTTQIYPRDIPGLTSLRFFAAFWVVIHHYVAWLVPAGAATPDIPVIGMGSLAVDFFFVLSGFILTHAHRDQLAARALPYRDFLIKRIARIYPMHILTLFFYLVMILVLSSSNISLPNPDRYNFTQFILNVFLVHAWQFYDAGAWNYPSWSVSAEWAAYLIFPFLAFPIISVYYKSNVALMLLISLVVLILFWMFIPILIGKSLFELHSNFGYLRIFPEFVLGIVLYKVGTTYSIPILGHPLIIFVITLIIIVMAWFRIELMVVIFLSVLIFSVAENARNGRTGILSAKPLVYAGEISYDLYMVHLPVATIMLKGTAVLLNMKSSPAWLLPIAIFVALIAAALCHRYFETPARLAIVAAWRRWHLQKPVA